MCLVADPKLRGFKTSQKKLYPSKPVEKKFCSCMSGRNTIAETFAVAHGVLFFVMKPEGSSSHCLCRGITGFLDHLTVGWSGASSMVLLYYTPFSILPCNCLIILVAAMHPMGCDQYTGSAVVCLPCCSWLHPTGSHFVAGSTFVAAGAF